MAKSRIQSLKWSLRLAGRGAVRLGLLAAFAAGCASGPKHRGREVEMEEVTFSFEKDTTQFSLFDQYRIQPGDILDVLYQIKTWEEKESFKLTVDNEVAVRFPKASELDQSQRIRPDGKISLPYLGEVYVVGMTVTDLTKHLQEEYAKILKDVELYVLVPEFRSAIKELKNDLHTAPRGLSRLVTVRPDGYCTFAMVGDVFVVGKTIPEVNDILNGKYGSVLPGLSVDLFLEKHEGSVVYILGEVAVPGAHKILRPTAVAEALALAGGPLLQTAKLSDVTVVRRHDDKMVGTKVNVKRSLGLRNDSAFFFLEPDDIVYVPRKTSTKMADFMRDFAQIILFRGWSIGLGYDLNEGQTVPQATATAIVGP
ncbi:MAG: sugar transporter [Lentisphaerae bacterium]|nr:sugar transporter [Lentisphaerota bacterium]